MLLGWFNKNSIVRKKYRGLHYPTLGKEMAALRLNLDFVLKV
jgi:hypothetical protein